MSLAERGVTVMLPVEDVDRARKFYVESLGLDYTGTNGEGSALFQLGGGAALMLLPRPGGARAESTAISWEVDDVVKEVEASRARASSSRTTTCPGSRPSGTSRRRRGRRPPGSATRTATSCACTSGG